MSRKPIMPTATAVWLVDNTTLTFKQISRFCGLHELEVQSIADDETNSNPQGQDPILNLQLAPDEIKRAEENPEYDLQLLENPAAVGEERRRGPRYTPLSKRQDRPAAIAWLIKNHPNLKPNQISKLIGTTKTTIDAIRDRKHWNINNIQPTDPVALGLCRQIELDEMVRISNERTSKGKEGENKDTGKKILSTEESIRDVTRTKSSFQGLEEFSLGVDSKESDSQ